MPHFEVAATDSCGGFIGTTNDESIYYIDREGKCFRILEDRKGLRSLAPDWKKNMIPWDGIRVYPSKEEAEKELEFIDIPETKKTT